MRDFDVYELHTAAEIDAAFAKTFRLPSDLNWAQGFDQNAVSDFLESFAGSRKIQTWTLKLRNWNRGKGNDYMGIVSSKRQHGGVKLGCEGYGFSDYACHALMKAAIEWDQRRRQERRGKEQTAAAQ